MKKKLYCIVFFLLAFSLLGWAENRKQTNQQGISHPIRHENPGIKSEFRNPARFRHLKSVPGRILVKYKQNKSARQMEKTLRDKYRMEQIRYIPFAGVHVYDAQDIKSQYQLIKNLRNESSVAYVEPDYIIRMNAVPNDPSFSQSWGLNNTGQSGGTVDADIDAPEAWNLSTGSNSVVVAVLDSGIDYTHPDLAANMWVNPGETPGDGIDNDGNGYIDDIYGIDAVNSDCDPMDDQFHGTHTAGIIGAVGNNGIGTAGVSWNVKLMALKTLDIAGTGSTSWALTCIQYAIDNGANIINAGWGSSYGVALYDAVEAAGNAGILVVAASGNLSRDIDGEEYYPAAYDLENIISVAALDHDDNLDALSDYGIASVDVAAPGAGIYSTIPGGSYENQSGTSAAAAHVTGLAALLKAHQPALTVPQLKERIMDTVDPLVQLNGKIKTGGRVNAYYALANIPSPSLTITNPSPETFVSGTVTLSADAVDVGGITKVEFYIDDQLKAAPTTAPWQYNWDTTAHPNGNRILKVIAYNTAGRIRENIQAVPVDNSGTPAVMFLDPQNGASIKSTVDIRLAAAYDPGIDHIELFLDEVKIGEVTTAPYQFTWNTLGTANGPHSIKAVAHGTDAQVGESSITVSILNQYLPAAEREALIAFYNSTNGDSWSRNTNWKKPDGSFNDPGSEYSWFGVTIKDGHVNSLAMEFRNVGGVLPPELGNLSYLQYLHLPMNPISGSIPPQLGNLSRLIELNLSCSALSGNIPPELGNLTALKYLNFDLDNFSGSIPVSLCNLVNLEHLSLYQCGLTGTIPPELGNLTSLTFFCLSYNHLTGPIPPEIGNMASLETLWLTSNNLDGSLPPEIGNLANLKSLNLNYNSLSGPLPPNLGNLSNALSIKLQGCAFRGEIPVELMQLNKLSTLELAYNALYTDNVQLEGFLYAKKVGWDYTQTVAPRRLHASASSPTAITVRMYSFYYIDDDGGFRVFYSTTPGGPYTEAGMTPSKYDLSYTVTGLTPGIPYYFVVQTQTNAHSYNPNVLISDYSPEATGIIADTYTLNIESLPDTGVPITVSPVDLNGNGDGSTNITRTYNSGTTITLTAPPEHNGKPFKWWHINGFRRSSNTVDFVIGNNCTVYVEYETPEITILSPNGGDTLVEGTICPLIWENTEYVRYVDIAYSSTGTGGTFTSIASNVYSRGYYEWTVPAVESDQCIIRITETGGGPVDMSDAPFTIRYTPTVEITAPNGGESWSADSSRVITWNNHGTVGNVSLWYSKTGQDGYYFPIAEDIANTGSYSWSIPPDLDSSNCYIRIRETGGSVEDYSDNAFTLFTALPATERQALIDFYNACGGDNWLHNDGWKTQPLFSDGFAMPGTENSWYGITVTDNHVTEIRTDANGLNGTLPSSLQNLTQLQTLEIINDSTVTGSIPPELGNLSALQYLNLAGNQMNGSLPQQLGNLSALQSLICNGNRFTGEIPTSFSNLTQLTADNNDLGYNGLYANDPTLIAFLNTKDTDWAGTQTIAPAGVTAAAITQTSIQVTWTPVAFTAYSGNYNVYYSSDSGGPYTLFGSTADKNADTMTVTGLNTGITYYFAVTTVTDPHENNSNTVESNYSAEASVTAQIPVLTLTAPNGGENWVSGSSQNITWTSQGIVGNVKIEYSSAGIGGTYVTIVDSTANNGSYSWNIPEVDSAQCIVRISETDGDPVDTSNGVFTIEPSPSVTVTSPNGGENWKCGTSQTITWTTVNMTGDVTAHIYKGENQVLNLGTVPAADGTIIWPIPGNLTAGSDYRVRVFQGTGEVEDYSDAYFTVSAAVHPDLNGDGHTDLFWRNKTTGENGVWLMNGTTRLNIVLFNTLSPAWVSGGTNDFNGDGKTDILWRNETTGENGIWMMDGTTRTNIVLFNSLSAAWESGGTGDFNSDGKPDIMWHHKITGENGVWMMDGTTRTSIVFLPTLSDTNWYCGGLGDFNGDGKPDILWRNRTTGQNGVWMMNGTTRTNIVFLNTLADTNWYCGGVGDFNGDGKPDIFWRHTVTGENGVWFMNGTSRIGQAFINTLSDVNWELGN